MSTWQMDREAVRKLTEGVVLNTDDNMRIESAAPLHLHASTSDQNVSLLLDSALVPPWVEDPVDILDLGYRYLDRDDFQRGVEAAIRALEASEHEQAQVAAERARRRWDEDGWEKAVLVVVAAGEELSTSGAESLEFERAWGRWRVAMLQYFGQPVTPAQYVRAGLPSPRPAGDGPLGAAPTIE